MMPRKQHWMAVGENGVMTIGARHLTMNSLKDTHDR
jgi:hypothetical protein